MSVQTERSARPHPENAAPGWSDVARLNRSSEPQFDIAATRRPGADVQLFQAGRTLRLTDTVSGLQLQDTASEGLGTTPADPLAPIRVALRSPGPWAGWLSYDLGRHLEPAAGPFGLTPGQWPLVELRQLSPLCTVLDPARHPSNIASPRIGDLCSEHGAAAYMRGVSRVLDYIRAGDCYQANLAHELTATFDGSPRDLFAAIAQRTDPPHAMYLEAAPDSAGVSRVLLSLSPELFLHYDAATRRVITRPMKGTRACVPGAYEALDASEKDRAELAMIVDLMRNDLGRVCQFGSVSVDIARKIERHDNAAGGVWQAIAQVSGTLRPELDAADLIAATFPAGSVTGAPKIRAMQIIDELEPTRRGVYCGSAIHIHADGSLTLNVAIRTALIEGTRVSGPDHLRGTLRYSVGAGIVADSDPASEWHETLVKAGVLSGVTQFRAGATP